MYAYMSLVKDVENFKNEIYIRAEMVDLWKRKNIRNTTTDDALPISKFFLNLNKNSFFFFKNIYFD